MSESIYCAHVRPDGTPCRAYADRDNGYCWHHRPADTPTADRQRDRTTEPILDAPAQLDSVEDVHRVMAQVANHVLTAPRPAIARSHALCTSAGVLLRAINIRDLQREAASLREQLRQTEQIQRDLERRLKAAQDNQERCRDTIQQLRQHIRQMSREAQERSGRQPI